MKRRLLILAAVTSLSLAQGCGSEPSAPVSAVRPVVVSPVEVVRLTEQIEATGEILARDQAEIASEVAGRITSLYADEGDRVEVEAVLLEIDPERRQLELANARAGLGEARASWEESQRELKRVQTLHERAIASESRLDQVQTQLAMSRSRLEAARAQVGVAERALRDAQVTAPFGGMVSRREVSRGEYVRVGQVLFELVALDPIEVEFHVAEQDSARVAEGQLVEVRVAPHPDESFQGEVTIISPIIDMRTRTLRVKARMDNSSGHLRPGLFARVDLGLSERDRVIMVPEEAILQRRDGQVVFRNGPDNRVERVLVQTGTHRAGRVEIVSGLEAGDVVVSRGQASLFDGGLVSPRNLDGTPIEPAGETSLSAAGELQQAVP